MHIYMTSSFGQQQAISTTPQPRLLRWYVCQHTVRQLLCTGTFRAPRSVTRQRRTAQLSVAHNLRSALFSTFTQDEGVHSITMMSARLPWQASVARRKLAFSVAIPAR